VNVAGLDDNVFSDTLFGHRKGAFTGADENRPGLVERAAGGTLFLDEIGDVSLAGQVKLLRLIQEREYSALGSDTARKTDARVVVATNQDLRRLREAGRFRPDLFYRLHTHALHLPPLRQRPGDVPLLLDHFLDKAARELGKRRPTPPRELPLLLQTYDFPGNVRELEAMVFDAVSRHTARMLGMETFRAHIEGADGGEERAGTEGAAGSASGAAGEAGLAGGPTADAAAETAAPPALVFPARLPTLAEAADQLVAEALARASGNQAIAARLIGVSRQALNRRLNRRRG
jgi:DNA-binding NtrC family response regulator